MQAVCNLWLVPRIQRSSFRPRQAESRVRRDRAVGHEIFIGRQRPGKHGAVHSASRHPDGGSNRRKQIQCLLNCFQSKVTRRTDFRPHTTKLGT